MTISAHSISVPAPCPSFNRHNLALTDPNHQLITTIHQNHQLSGGLYHLLFTFVSSLNVLEELLESFDYFRRRYDFCFFTEASNPTVELVTDFNIRSHNKMSVIVGLVISFRSPWNMEKTRWVYVPKSNLAKSSSPSRGSSCIFTFFILSSRKVLMFCLRLS